MHDTKNNLSECRTSLMRLVLGICLVGFGSSYIDIFDDLKIVINLFLFFLFVFTLFKINALNKELLSQTKAKVKGFIYLVDKIRNLGVDEEAEELFNECGRVRQKVNSPFFCFNATGCYKEATALENKMKNYIIKLIPENIPY